MRLEKGMIKDVKLGREEVVGLKLNGTYLFETTGPSYWNKYTIKIPRGAYLIATVVDKDMVTINSEGIRLPSRNENGYALYVDWGTGTPVQYDSATRYAQRTYNTSGISTPYVTLTIKTTGELDLSYTGSNALTGEYVTDIASVRTDYMTGASLFYDYSKITTIREPVLERLNTSVFPSMSAMFMGCSSMEKLNLASFRTDNVTDMYCMFSGCSSLISLDVSHFCTDNVTNMTGVFGNCQSLTKLDLSKWNTDNATKMGAMFSRCKLLTELNLSKFRTSNVKYMNGMFEECSSLIELDLSNFDTSKIIHSGQYDPEVGGYAVGDGLDGMFSNCTSLRILNLANCSKDTVRDMITSKNFPTGLVNGQLRTIYCKEEASNGLNSIVPYGWTFSSEIPEVPVEPEIPLYEPYQFKEKYITEVVTMVNESHDDLSSMFEGCYALVSVNTPDWDTSNVTNMNSMFYCCSSLTELDLSNFNTSKVIDMGYMFGYCESLPSIDVSNFNTDKVANMGYMFRDCSSLTSLDLNNFNVANVTNMQGMFINCSSLTTLDLSNFNNQATNVWSMFENCTSLEELDLRNFSISSSALAINMFKNCTSLHALHLENCDTTTINKIINSSGFPTGEIEGETRIIYCSKDNAADLVEPEGWIFSFRLEEEPEVPVDPPEPEIPLYDPGQFKDDTTLTEVVTMVDSSYTDLSYMFLGCTNLTSVNVQDWDISNVIAMHCMFQKCESLIELDLSSWDTSRVQNMFCMFSNCTSLEVLDLRNFDTCQVVNINSMFNKCTSLRAVHLDNCDYNTLCAIFRVLPTNTIEGVTKYVYCSQGASEEIEEPPTSWNFWYTS